MTTIMKSTGAHTAVATQATPTTGSLTTTTMTREITTTTTTMRGREKE